jgi:hypothetical protein
MSVGGHMSGNVHLSGFDDLPQPYVRWNLDLSRIPDMHRQLYMLRQFDLSESVHLHRILHVSRHEHVCGPAHVRRCPHMLGDDFVQWLGVNLRRPIHLCGIDYLFRYQYLPGYSDLSRRGHLHPLEDLRADLDLSGQPDL